MENNIIMGETVVPRQLAMEEQIAVILVNYNGLEYNDKCIQSILNSTVHKFVTIVVVDNNSTDESGKVLQEHWGTDSRVHLIELEENVGFARANNTGIRWAMEQGIRLFLLLNNDTEIEVCAIEEMMKLYREKRGIISPKILYGDTPSTIWCAGGKLTSLLKKPIQIGENKQDSLEYNKEMQCEFANGCAMLLDKDIIETIGFLDESFFLYYEDTEYSMRAIKKGVSIWYCPKAVVYHKVNGSTKGNESYLSAYYITRNWLIYTKMHLGWRFTPFVLYFILNRMAWVSIWSLQGKHMMPRAVLRGVKDFRVWHHNRAQYSDRISDDAVAYIEKIAGQI